MAQHLLLLAAICFMWLFLFGTANGTGSVAAKADHNHSLDTGERTRRDVAQQVEQQTTSLIPPNSVAGGQNGDNEKSSLQLNFGALKELSLVKRAPNGFTGMRGKKENQLSDFDSNPAIWYTNELDEREDTDEDYSESYGARRWKKAPTAFYGVRGKKYAGNDYQNLNDFLLKLEEERLRESLLQDFLDRLATSTLDQNEVSKRAPTGFTGMRGKRPANFYDDEEEMEKRGPTNAFLGVRGKKDVDHQNFKRSPADPFNRRVKNQRFVDLSNKFVAVRGKKGSSSAADLSDEISNDDVTHQSLRPARARFFVNMLPSLLYGMNDKRTPNGFMGMRGKRAVNMAAYDYSDDDSDTAANERRIQ